MSSTDSDSEVASSKSPSSKDAPLTLSSPAKVDRPKVGHTVYIFGYNVTEDILKKAFHPFGNIVNISMEIEKKYYNFKLWNLHKPFNKLNKNLISTAAVL